MSESGVISAQAFREAFLATCERMQEARDQLCELDAAAGDGDLGATLATGFAAVRESLLETDHPEPGPLLTQAGVQLARKAPSTIGALLASGFMRAGKELSGTSALSGRQVAGMLRAVATGVAERGGAAPGQRTVLDSMNAAAAAAEAASPSSATVVLQQAAVAARAGADATAEMEPAHGRAAWIPERARGRPDAGAVAWALFLAALVESIGNPEATRSGDLTRTQQR